MRLLIDLSHAAGGYVGIAQDIRLIFSMLCDAEGVEPSGLLMAAGRHDLPHLRPGDPDAAAMTAAVLHAMERNWDGPERLGFPRNLGQTARFVSQQARIRHALLPAAGRGQGDSIWRMLFGKTLEPARRGRVLEHAFYGTDLSVASVIDRALRLPASLHKRLDTPGFDAVLFCMPRPVRLLPGVRQIMRFHDAVPVTDADTVGRWQMGLAHSRLVRACDPDAVFVCNSPQSRENLLAIDPTREPTSVVIPCALAPEMPASPVLEVASIIERHLTFRALGADGAPPGWERPETGMRYVLAVSTLEPRKNYAGLIRGWERAAARMGDTLRLVIVGGRGWREEALLEQMRPGVASGRILHLENVPQDELQALMRGGACFALPSFNEGFGYSPLEAMQVGTACVVSDIPVFRWIFGDSVLYADPYDPDSIAAAIESASRHGASSSLGASGPVLRHFQPDTVKAEWQRLVERLADEARPQA